MLTRSSTINAGWKCTRNSRATGTRGTHAIPFVPPHIRLGKKKIAVLDRRLREKTSADQQGQDKSEERGPECRTVHHGPFCDTLSPPPHLLSHSISPYHPLSSRYPHSFVPLHRSPSSPPPRPFFFNLHHTSSRFSSLFSPFLSLSLSFSLPLHSKTVPPLSRTRTRDVNRSKVGMANLRTVTNTIWAHLFFSSTVFRSSLRPLRR